LAALTNTSAITERASLVLRYTLMHRYATSILWRALSQVNRRIAALEGKSALVQSFPGILLRPSCLATQKRKMKGLWSNERFYYDVRVESWMQSRISDHHLVAARPSTPLKAMLTCQTTKSLAPTLSSSHTLTDDVCTAVATASRQPPPWVANPMDVSRLY